MTKRPASHAEFKDWDKTYDPRAAQVTPGYTGAIPTYRDERDARLAGVGVRNRFPDEALGGVRSNVRSYSRGVHVGERLSPAAYLWPDEFNPDTGLKLEAQGLKWAPADEAPTTSNRLGNEPIPTQIDPQRQSTLSRMLPNWR